MEQTLTLQKRAYFFGFSRWKRGYTRPFFPQHNLHFCISLEKALKLGLDERSEIFIWGKKAFDEVESYAERKGIPLFRVEDGFVRSVSLGSDLTKAYSLVVDGQGIYFDPTHPSDLEHTLNTYDFDEKLLERARKLRRYLVEKKISKYNIYGDKVLRLEGLREGQRVAMVPGQVEDDASIRYGANGMQNIELLREARRTASDAYIIYKPHPDVLVGNREGNVTEEDALQYCDTIITEASLDSVLMLADEVHTMTSLVGFEALLRGKKVYTYGMPFYAGWGVTVDIQKSERRTTQRTLDELVAAAFILYPRYIDPQDNSSCEIEQLLEVVDKEKNRYNNDTFYKLRVDIRNWISRKIQLLIKVILGE
jgi:capsular polysaccharide export protein